MIASAQVQSRRYETPVVSAFEGWTIHQYSEVTSTNLVAARLPPWTAVRADMQTNGRGRFQRAWISDRGGLWLSAVVPTDRDALARRALPLAVGLAVCDSLRSLGVSRLRLRWPNDVLVDDRKLAGLLIDNFAPSLAVIGIGINVQNQPESLDPTMKNRTTRLSDLLPAIPELDQLTTLVLRHVRLVLTQLQQLGTMSLLLRVNKLWAAPRRVELDLDGTFRGGLFTGVDDEGRLKLSDEVGNVTFYDAHEVRHLTET